MDEVKNKFRESMSRLATGVTIVMTEIEGRPWGLTVSACCSISMEPPLILISLATQAASTQAIINNQRFSVSVLAEDQIEVARSGAKAGAPKFFEEFAESKGSFNYDVKNALASVHCRVEQTVTAGDHTIFIGFVEDVILGESKSPLLHFDRQFGEFNTAVRN
ncbi:flavin reductase ActVB [Bacillus niacini]|uniref:Flavin reductase ActVB n=1 Tax=Neobacillus niacini TaxID=86668 RepID=A0A852TE50_9BACI|nr:flavin reductase family protein [Neobacillus niacini]NYE06309.1 flavin reductase ActVB [Neobacillus niacini]